MDILRATHRQEFDAVVQTLDAHALKRGLSLVEHIECEMSNNRHVFRRMVFQNPGLVFVKHPSNSSASAVFFMA
jgi:hypothetical protein